MEMDLVEHTTRHEKGLKRPHRRSGARAFGPHPPEQRGFLSESNSIKEQAEWMG